MLFERILDIFWQNRPILQISVTWTHREIYSNFSTFPNSSTTYIKSRLPYENAPWVFATTSTLTSLINEETRILLLEFFSIHLEKILPSRLLIVKKITPSSFISVMYSLHEYSYTQKSYPDKVQLKSKTLHVKKKIIMPSFWIKCILILSQN